MKCIRCESDARAVCQFCGRAVCAEHIGKKRYVFGFTSVGGMWSFSQNAFAVEDAVWCGRCHPEYKVSS